MAESNPKGIGNWATGWLGTLAAAATVIAAIAGLLSQFGIIGNHDAPKPVIVTIPVAQPLPASNQIVAAAPSAKPSPAQVVEAPHPHRTPKPKPHHTEVAAAEPATPAQPRATNISAAEPSVSGASPPAASPAAAVAPAASAAMTQGASPQMPAASTTLAMVEPAGPSNIAGAWRDMGIGACHLINQSGTKFEVTNYDPSTGEVISQGQGTVDGNHVEIEFPSSRRPVSEDFHVSPDGRAMYGKIFRIDGPHRAMWNYIGPNCTKPG